MLVLGLALAWAQAPHHHLVPEVGPDRHAMAAWAREAGWVVSPVQAFEGGGTRFGAFVHGGPDAVVEVQGVADDARSPWQPVETTWTDGATEVRVAELGAWYPRARVRVRGAPDRLDWEIRVPVDEPRAEATPRPPGVSAALQAIGVVSRETWGSRSTTCTSPEDDWYRFAIHHTAGSQTSGGTVQGSVQGLQAYAMDSGGYCDIPYQFLVGYDGSLWEGRPLDYYSGATGGGNNDGNIAVCFLGCYDASGCGSSYDDATDDMMVWARLLMQTLGDDHGIVTDEDNTRGHGDWPDNATACPGSEVKARLDELRQADAPYQASLVALSTDELEVPLDDERELTVELENTGTETWAAGHVYLAPTPRDEAPSWAGSDWPSTTRAATLDDDVGPGEVGSFTFSVAGDAVGEQEIGFALVAEWVTWFGDIPWGGGPDDDAITLTLVVTEGGGPPGAEDTGEVVDDDGPGVSGPPLTQSMTRVPLATMGGCAVPTSAPWVFGLLVVLRRRGRCGSVSAVS